MAGINKVILVGRLGKDPELRYSSSGKAVASFSLATDSGFGESKKTEWHNIVVFDKTAENCSKYLKKGRMVYVEGRITYRKWQKDENTSVNITDIIAHDVQFLERADAPSYDAGGGGYQQQNYNRQQQNSQFDGFPGNDFDNLSNFNQDLSDEDTPFDGPF